MGKLIPGRLYSHNGKIFRIKKQTNGCVGCALNKIVLCPNIEVTNSTNNHFPCDTNGIILIEP